MVARQHSTQLWLSSVHVCSGAVCGQGHPAPGHREESCGSTCCGAGWLGLWLVPFRADTWEQLPYSRARLFKSLPTAKTRVAFHSADRSRSHQQPIRAQVPRAHTPAVLGGGGASHGGLHCFLHGPTAWTTLPHTRWPGVSPFWGNVKQVLCSISNRAVLGCSEARVPRDAASRLSRPREAVATALLS